jgi:hypothetical protein
LLSVLRPAERESLDRVLDKLERRSAEIFARSDAWREIVRASAADVDAEATIVAL